MLYNKRAPKHHCFRTLSPICSTMMNRAHHSSNVLSASRSSFSLSIISTRRLLTSPHSLLTVLALDPTAYPAVSVAGLPSSASAMISRFALSFEYTISNYSYNQIIYLHIFSAMLLFLLLNKVFFIVAEILMFKDFGFFSSSGR